MQTRALTSTPHGFLSIERIKSPISIRECGWSTPETTTNDGKSELVFSIDRENEGGYQIWYDNFTKHATFKFHYH